MKRKIWLLIGLIGLITGLVVAIYGLDLQMILPPGGN